MVVTNSSLKEPDCIYQYYMGQWGGCRFQETFDQKMNVKHINVYSLSVIFFLEAALKCRPRAIEA